MFELVLIDDRRDIVQGIAAAVDWQARGVSVRGFYNGADALAYCTQHMPDLVLTDICMPLMSGLDFAKNLLEVHPEARIVLLTGYDEFEYAREGIRLGVVEYLSKPVRIEAIEALVDKERTRAQARAAQQTEELREYHRFRRSLPALRRQWLQKWLAAPEKYDAQQLESALRELEIPLSPRELLPVAVHLQPLEDADGEKMDTLQYAAGNMTCELLENDFASASMPAGEQEMLLLLDYSGKSRVEAYYKAAQCIAQCRERCEPLLNAALFAGVGLCAPQAADLPQAIESARQALAQNFFLEKPAVVCAVDLLQAQHEDPAYPAALQDEIVRCLRQDDLEASRTCMQKFFGVLAQMRRTPPDALREKLLVLLLRMVHECQAQQFLHAQALLDDFKKSYTLGQIRRQFLAFLDGLQRRRDERGEMSVSIAAVKSYIDAHYSENITLKKMSDYSRLSPAYLSYAFKEAVGINFNDYLTQVRMEQAKRLLSTTDCKVYEVCERIGYKDKKYFSDLFKKYTGVLPRDWK